MEDELTTKFLFTALMGDINNLAMLIEHGADVNMQNDIVAIQL